MYWVISAKEMSEAKRGVDYKDIEDGHQTLRKLDAGTVIPCDLHGYQKIKNEFAETLAQLQAAVANIEVVTKRTVEENMQLIQRQFYGNLEDSIKNAISIQVVRNQP